MLELFWQFFHIGLFSYGGGYATLPFLYNLVDKWYSSQQLSDMIAISSITPGPIGINMATFAGFTAFGILGALIATTSIILPSFLLVNIISRLYEKFKDNQYVKYIIYSLKPASCGLLVAVILKILKSNINITTVIILMVLFLFSIKRKHQPIFYLFYALILFCLLSNISFLPITIWSP